MTPDLAAFVVYGAQLAVVVLATEGAGIVYGRTRERCIMRLRRALQEMVIEGVKTSIPLHCALIEEPVASD